MSCSTPTEARCASTIVVRTSFGLALLFVGLIHYMTILSFVHTVSDGLGPLTVFGKAWAYVLPALFVAGGTLFALGMYLEWAAWIAGIGLGSIPVGVLLKPIMSGVPLAQAMPSAVNAFVWLTVYLLVVRCCNSK